MFICLPSDSDVRAESYIPRATYSPCRDGCAGCGRPFPPQDEAGYPKRYPIGVSEYHYGCYKRERRAIRETERVLTKAGLERRFPKLS